MSHAWFICAMCGPSVHCGKCGNNACNGGHGTLPDGTDCDACAGAYEMQRSHPVPLAMAEEWALQEANPLADR
jgi:hypothetical protein